MLKRPVWACLCVTVSAAVLASDGLEIKGVTVGLAESELISSGRASLCQTTTNGTTRFCTIDSQTLANVPTSLFVALIVDSKVAAVTATFSSDQFDHVVAALEAKHGPPTGEQRALLSNRLGMAVENKTLHWLYQGQQISAEKYSGNLDRSRVTLTSESAVGQVVEEKERRAKDASGDL